MRMNEEQRKAFYTTLDSYQAGFLKLRGHTPDLIQERNKIVFAFKSTPKLRDDLSDYYAGATVEALSFSNAIKQLKSEIFSRKSNIPYE